MIPFPRRFTFTLVLVVLAVLALPALAITPGSAANDYQRLLEWRFSETALAVPEGGLSFDVDAATFHLDRGAVRPMQPTAEGVVTGFVFEGEGRFRLAVPHAVERENLARLSGQPLADAYETGFRRLVLRGNGEQPAAVVAAAGGGDAPSGPYAPDDMARRVHARWIEQHGVDVDARVVCGLLTPDDLYLRAEMDNGGEPVIFTYEGLEREEVRLDVWRNSSFIERWVSLDRAADRRADGSPSGERHGLVDVEHVDVEIDLTGKTRSIRSGPSRTLWRDVGFVSDLRFVPRRDGLRAIGWSLSSGAEVISVQDAAGRDLVFLRDHRGRRTNDLDNDVWDDSLVVLLPEPLAAGEPVTLRFTYELPLPNFAPGRSWYPGLPDGFNDRHTMVMTIHNHQRHQVRAAGRMTSEEVGDGVRTTVWEIDRPAKMVSFTYGDDFIQKVLVADGVPRVVSFGPQVSKGWGSAMIRNVGADVVNSLRFFQWLLDDELPYEEIQITGIAAYHGQAFQGFLHAAESTYQTESPGASEMFRAHETAHLWWGHRIGWKSYRDQWLSESLAEYTAMMYVEATMKNGRDHLEEILDVYTHNVRGSLSKGFSKYSRPWLGGRDLDQRDRDRLGPICLGWRAATVEMPYGYTAQVYYRGPLVLHMLREVLAGLGQGDDYFVAVLRRFVDEYAGKDASTEDFVRVVNEVVPGDWTFFFDEWLCGVDEPTYRWDYRTARNGDGGWTIDLDVEQRDVPEGFVMPVPVAIDLGGGRTARYTALMDGAEKSFQIPVPEKPRKVVLAPGHSLLAKVERR